MKKTQLLLTLLLCLITVFAFTENNPTYNSDSDPPDLQVRDGCNYCHATIEPLGYTGMPSDAYSDNDSDVSAYLESLATFHIQEILLSDQIVDQHRNDLVAYFEDFLN